MLHENFYDTRISLRSQLKSKQHFNFGLPFVSTSVHSCAMPADAPWLMLAPCRVVLEGRVIIQHRRGARAVTVGDLYPP